MDSRLSRWCDGLIEAGWLAAVIAVPLFFNIHSDRVFEPDKLALLRSIAVLMAAAWLVKFIDQRGWEQAKRLRWRDEASIWRVPFILAVTLLVLVYLVSTVLSVTPSVSWAGSYQRLQGTYTTLSYITIFAVTIATMRTRAQARRLVTAVIITSIPIAFYGLLQHFDLDPLPWAGNVQERVAGHMGNAIFIAAYLIMAVPLTAARVIASFASILGDEELATADVTRSSIYIFTLSIQLIAIYWSGSRGPWLGLAVGLFAFTLIVLVALRNAVTEKGRFRLAEAGKALLLVLAGTGVAYGLILLLLNVVTASGRAASLAGPMASFVAFMAAVGVVVVAIFAMVASRRGWRWLWLSWISLAVFLGVWLVLFNLPPELTDPYDETPLLGDVLTTLEEWRDLPRIGRLGRVLEADQGTGRVRTLIWQGALELILPHEPLRFPDGRLDTFNFLRPLIGYGPESMYVAFNRFYPPELATLEARNASPDRSHNETFDALVITGLAGFLVWQALYLSVFYYGFRWLGVLRSKFDRNLLIGLWIGGGVLVAIVFALWRGPEYIGVALPFGSIAGLVLYLIYYALFAEPPAGEAESQPFAADRLLMAALVAAVLAHYVEIHFGIAIAATRLHFFLYVGVMLIVGYWLPSLRAQPATPEPAPATKRRRRRSGRPRIEIAFAGWTGPVLLATFMLALIVGILGFEFTTYSPPPDKVLESMADLPAAEVFHQSFFVNSRRGFVDSPFIFLMIVLTWALGVLVSLSEMVKDGEIRFPTTSERLAGSRQTVAAAAFAVLAVINIGLRFLRPLPVDAGATWLLGRTLLLLWGLVCLWAAVRLFMGAGSARFTAGAIAMTGLVFTLPVMIAGSVLPGLLTACACLGILYLLWDRAWTGSLLPAALLAFLSLSTGLALAYFQAFLLRNSLFYQATLPAIESLEQLNRYRVLEASQAAGFLTAFYLFVFVLIVAAAIVLGFSRTPRTRHGGSAAAYGGLAVLAIASFIIISATNVRVIQADIIYKRGRFYDDQATRSRDANQWAGAIAIYQEAIARAPREDFYYLFLGRAYLEQSTLTADPAEQAALLDEAESRLLEAQAINPLNTDHTANLARLHTRWIGLGNDTAEREERLQSAEAYYQDALALSPQNSVIRNEYARLALEAKQDCEQAIALYNESLAIDPFFSDTYFALAETYVGCAAGRPENVQADYHEQARSMLAAGLDRDDSAGTWLQAAQTYQQMGAYEEALAAYDEVQARNENGVIPDWNIDFLRASLYLDMGDQEMARQWAQQALALAPAEATAQIQEFLNQLGR